MLRALSLVLLVVSMTACSSKQRVDSFIPPTTRLSPQASFYVVVPKDARYANEFYPGSGEMAALACVGALSRHVGKVEQGQGPEDLTQALATAKQRGLTNVLEPTILHWEDRATEWSGIPDKITLKYAVYDVATGASVASAVLSASSKWATLGGDHPQDLLPLPTNQFVDKLF